MQLCMLFFDFHFSMHIAVERIIYQQINRTKKDFCSNNILSSWVFLFSTVFCSLAMPITITTINYCFIFNYSRSSFLLIILIWKQLFKRSNCIVVNFKLKNSHKRKRNWLLTLINNQTLCQDFLFDIVFNE